MPSREPIQEGVGLGVQVQFFAPITVLLGQPRRQELQSTLARSSSGFALSCGLEGRGLQCEPEDLNEKAGCGGSAGLLRRAPLWVLPPGVEWCPSVGPVLYFGRDLRLESHRATSR